MKQIFVLISIDPLNRALPPVVISAFTTLSAAEEAAKEVTVGEVIIQQVELWG